MSESEDWKSEFYAAYVSSGQAADSGETAGELFRPRMAYLTHIVERHVSPEREARVIDLGCGAGGMLYALGLRGYRDVAGVDISGEQIAVARRLGITAAACAPLEEFLAGQAAESVDTVLAIDILEHMTRPEVMAVLAEVRRVLKPGGRCVAHVPNAEGLHAMAVRYGDFTHELAFTRVSASQIFRVAGFSAVRCFEDKPLVHGGKSAVRRAIWEVGTLPSRLLRMAETGAGGAILSQNMMIEARL